MGKETDVEAPPTPLSVTSPKSPRSPGDLVSPPANPIMLKNNKGRMISLKREHKIYALGLLCVCLFLYYFFSSGSSAGTQYVIVIDAGSTGSRIHVYPYSAGTPLIDIHLGEDTSKKLKPGLSSYAETPDDAANSINDLLNVAREAVPNNLRSQTPIFLKASAGMRKVQAESEEKAEAVMQVVRQTLTNSEFVFQNDWASIITGVDEGLYGWVTANYLNGWLKHHEVDSSSRGVFEMGGESIQLTFIPHESSMKFIPKDKLRTLNIGNSEYSIFTYSWMGYGMEAAQKKHDEANVNVETSPCYNSGLEHEGNGNTWKGSGDYDACVKALMPLAKPGAECGDVGGLTCVVDSITVPTIAFEQFYYIENFFYTKKSLGVSGHGSEYRQDLASKGKSFCSLPKDQIKSQYPKMEDWEVAKECFGAAWINVLLDTGFDLGKYTRFEVIREVNEGDIDWAMGYAIQHGSSSQGGGFTSLFWFVLVVLMGAIVCIARQQGSSKTQYQPVNQYPL